jgi:thiosulfate/3-mercaptopyruvate sulfurtransferase
MSSTRAPRTFPLTAAVVFLSATLVILAVHAQRPAEPWTTAQTVQPAELQKELASGTSVPTVLFVGFQRLYDAGHIKGAQYHGTGASGEGLAGIKKWAEPLPRSTNLVIYCGCCPMNHCPNVRPAFVALHEMGFTKLRVLILPSSFAVDWAEKGLPYDQGQ